jgi:hypothetical protein
VPVKLTRHKASTSTLASEAKYKRN